MVISVTLLDPLCLTPSKPCRREAEEEARSEPLLSSFLHASVVSHDSFARSLAFVLANRLEDITLHSTELSDIFHTVLRDNAEVREAAIADIIAFRERVRARPHPQTIKYVTSRGLGNVGLGGRQIR